MTQPFDAISVGRSVLAVEAEALGLLADSLDASFVRAVEICASLKGRIVCTGVGKSGHVGRKVAATLASTGQPAMFIHATEASHGDLGMIGPSDAVLALSKSGETRELADVVAYAKRFGIPLLAITEGPHSALGRACDVLLRLPAAAEAAAAVDAPTTSTILQMAMGDALAVALLERRGFTKTDFGVFHPGGKLGSALRTAADLMHAGSELPLVDQAASMPQTLLVMTEKRFGCAGVVDDAGQLLGIITDGDLRRHMGELMGHKAGEIMTPGPAAASPAMLAGEALKIMNDKRITVLFVLESGRPIGILHVHDLLRAGVL
ncbi:MAG: KpsF/GutQ family sugar-phosphate isomerase [Caulobacteraceae bacterium]